MTPTRSIAYMREGDAMRRRFMKYSRLASGSSRLPSRALRIVLSAVFMTALVSLASPTTEASATQRSSVDPAATFLEKKYNISSAEAFRRLEVQDRATSLLDDLSRVLGDGYGGLWLDPQHGGRVVIGVLPGQERIVRQLATRRGVKPTVVLVKRSVRQLQDLRDQLQRDLPTDSELQVGAAYLPDNKITVLERKEPAGRIGTAQSDTAALKAELARKFPDLVRYRTVEGNDTTVACVSRVDTNPNTWCDAPLRGGVGITGGDKYCSAGFNVRSRSDGIRYLLTAGHCSDPHIFQTRFADNGIHNIGYRHNSVYGAAGDAMIIRLDNPTGWNPKPWVFVTGSSGTSRNESYEIARDGLTTIGMTVCMTGRRDGTQCGVVVDNDRPGAGGVAHVAEVSGGCVRLGDSGGPVYRSSTAYGIVHGGRFNLADLTGCAVAWYYQGIRGAQNLMNVNLVTTSNP